MTLQQKSKSSQEHHEQAQLLSYPYTVTLDEVSQIVHINGSKTITVFVFSF